MLFYPEELYHTVSEKCVIHETDKRWILDFRKEGQRRMKQQNLPLPNWTLLTAGSLCVIGPRVFHQAINLKVLTSIMKIDRCYQEKFNYRQTQSLWPKIIWQHYFLGELT